MERGITRHRRPTAPGGGRPQSSRDPRPTRSRRGVALRAIAALAAALSVFSVVSMASAQAAPTAPPPGSWIVTLQDGVGVDTVARSVGAAVRSRFTQALTAFSATLTEAQLARLEADPRVRSVTEDAVVAHVPRARRTPQAPPAPPSTQFVPEGVRRVGAAVSPTARIDGVDQRLDADIAVIDTGVDRTHPDLNVTDSKDCTGEGITSDSFGHGTEVAGVAAARDNRIGTVGVAPGARRLERPHLRQQRRADPVVAPVRDRLRPSERRQDRHRRAGLRDEGTPDTCAGSAPRAPAGRRAASSTPSSTPSTPPRPLPRDRRRGHVRRIRRQRLRRRPRLRARGLPRGHLGLRVHRHRRPPGWSRRARVLLPHRAGRHVRQLLELRPRRRPVRAGDLHLHHVSPAAST